MAWVRLASESDLLVGKLDVSDCKELILVHCMGNKLTEINAEGCTALTELLCSSNQLAALNVSKDTALKELHCRGNELITLDIGSNTALRFLSCGDNQLTELNISNNKLLEYIYCGSNQLTELDVSQNTALWLLECYDNRLTKLNISNNTALRELDCDSNQLTYLDISNNVALTMLDCLNNQLTELDVSNNTALTALYCGFNQLTELDVSKNTALTKLECEFNQLTELDVSNNTALKLLRCTFNHLTELDVSNNTALTALDCTNNQLTSLNLEENYNLPIDRVDALGDGFIAVSIGCATDYAGNIINKVYAKPKSGSTFVGWYDENNVLLSDKANFDISDIESKVFIAKFEEGSTDPTPTPTPEQPTPTPEQPTDGVTVDFNHNGGTVEYTYDEENYLLTLYITPKAGYYAKSISVNGSVVAENPTNPYVLDLRPYMKKSEVDAEIFVEFALIPGMRRVTVSSSSCGTVDVNMPDGSYTVDTDGSYLVNAGTELTLTMKPDANHYVWYVAVNGSVTAVRPGNVIKFTVETDMDITVVFRTDAAETTPAPTNPTKPPKTGAAAMTAVAIMAIISGAGIMLARKK